MNKLFILAGNLDVGGVQKVTVDLYNNLPSTLSRLLVCTQKNRNSNLQYKIEGEMIELSNSGSLYITRAINLPILITKYAILIHKYKPCLSLSMQHEENLINIISSLLTGIQPIISFHGMFSSITKSIEGKIINNIILFLAIHTNVKIVVVSYGSKKELVEQYGVSSSKIVVIHNPVDLKSIDLLSSENTNNQLITSQKQTIITLGTLTDRKGQHHLLRAFSKLHESYNCQLIICGDGPNRGYLESLSKELNISNDVHFMGRLENPYYYIAHSTLFVQSSLTESLPLVLIETLRCGCPIIAANCVEGIEEILGKHGEYGILASKQSGIKHKASAELDDGELSLLKNMRYLLDNPLLRNELSVNGKFRAEKFSIEASIEQYQLLFNLYLETM